VGMLHVVLVAERQATMPTARVVLTIMLGFCVLPGTLLPAEAAITVKNAAVINGAAVVEGRAGSEAPISWEGAAVTQANRGGNFAFQGVVPADCVGTLGDGTTTIEVALANCTSSLPVPPAPVPKTGQTICWDPSRDTSGVMIPCAGTGLDGDIQAGVPIPTPRFTDNLNGTATDSLTGLIWLKNASCFGGQTLTDALLATNTLASGSCGLSDGSVAGDWRLPNIRELWSLLDFGFRDPVLTNAAGTGHWTEGDPFTGVIWGNAFLGLYWSSTGFDSGQLTVLMDTGLTWPFGKGGPSIAWPVRGPK
jgi:hypothetical protein